MWTSRTEAIVMLPGGDCNNIKGGYSSPIKVMGVLTIPFSGLNLWICGLNLGLIFFLCLLMVDSLHLSLFFLYNFQYVIFFNISKQ